MFSNLAKHGRVARLVLAAGSLCFAVTASAWTVNLDFNNGTVGQKVAGVSAAGRTVYSRENSYEGGQGAKLTILQGEEGYGQWGGYISHPKNLKPGDELWFRVRMFFPAGFDYYARTGGMRLKFLRFDTRNAKTGSAEGYADIYIDKEGSASPFKFIFEGEARWANVGKIEHLPQRGVWETYEYYVKFHPVPVASGGEAVVRFWKNGELLQEVRDRKTLVSMDSEVRRTLLFTYWNGGAPQTQSMWVDDIVLTSDTPGAKDSMGNPFVGVGKLLSPPAAPTLNVER